MPSFFSNADSCGGLKHFIKAQLKNTKDLVFFKDAELKYLECSNSFLEFCNINGESIEGKNDFDIFSPELAEKYRRDDLEVLRTGEDFLNHVELIPSKNGQQRYGSTSKFLVKDDDGKIIGLYGITHDITYEVELEEEKHRSLFSDLLFENIFEADITLDKVLRIKGDFFNKSQHLSSDKSFNKIIQKISDEFITRENKNDFLTTFSCENLVCMYNSGIHEFKHYTSINYEKNNYSVICMCKVYRSQITHSIKITVCLKGIDEEEKANHSVSIDELTGVYNRRGISEEVKYRIEKRQAEIYALLFIDIDYFKHINDTYGHSVGDEVLKLSGEILRDSFKKQGIVGRVGGDEFLVFIDNFNSEEELEEEIRKIFSQLRSFWKNYPHYNSISYSIGVTIARYPKPYSQLVEEADEAMYEAKRIGRNSISFYREDKKKTGIYEEKKSKINLIKFIEKYGSSLHEIVMDYPYNSYTYIIDYETYELFSCEAVNSKYDDEIIENYKGKKCYEVLKGRTSPCVNCNKELLEQGKYHIHRTFDENTKKGVIYKETVSIFKGRKVLLIIAIDLSDSRRVEEILTKSIRARNALYECINSFAQETNIHMNLKTSIQAICESLGSDGGYIYLWNDNEVVAKFSTGEHDISPFYEKKLSMREQAFWYTQIKDINQIYIPNIKDADIDLDLKKSLLSKGINKLVAIPIICNKLLIGLIVVYNIEVELNDAIVLNVYADFISKNYRAIQAQDSIMYLQNHDPLTGCYNFGAFRSKSNQIISYSVKSKFAIIYFDIEIFKSINEKYGYEIGDRLLKYIVTCSKRDGSKEEIIGRVSGDIFCLLWKYEDIDSLERSYEELKGKISSFSDKESLNCHIHLNAGCYCINHGDDIIDAINHAANAHKIAKLNHSEKLLYFTEDIERKIIREYNIIQYFDIAIQKKEIKIFLQPQYEYSTGNIIGAEVLARWDSKMLGKVPPDEFIPILEHYGMIYELDKYIWETTCKQIRFWIDTLGENAVPPVSINISRQDIQKGDLCNVLLNILSKYKLSAEVLKIEFTETVYLADQQKLIDTVNKFKYNGFQCQLDDFGKGYSSINTLNEIPIDTIKLDISLVQGSENAERSGNLLASVVRMAHWLDLSIIAEGVETTFQAEFLKNIGCDYMQGYLFSKPVCVEDFTRILIESKFKTKYSLARQKWYKFEAKDFLNPSSIASQLFERIGPAAIIEHTSANSEILMINDNYLKLLGFTRLEYKEWMPHVQKRFSDDTRKIYREAFYSLIEGNSESKEIKIKVRNRYEKVVYLKSQIYLLSQNSKSNIFFVLADEIIKRY